MPVPDPLPALAKCFVRARHRIEQAHFIGISHKRRSRRTRQMERHAHPCAVLTLAGAAKASRRALHPWTSCEIASCAPRTLERHANTTEKEKRERLLHPDGNKDECECQHPHYHRSGQRTEIDQ